MAGKNQVTLTFAGDSDKLEKTFDRVGDGARGMSGEVGQAGQSFDQVGEAADRVDTRAMGFRDTMTGVQDTMRGTALLAKGPSFEGFVTLGMGVGDLASGMFNLLVPMAKVLLTTGLQSVANAGHAASQMVVRGATLAWTGAQWLLNAALTANPIGLVIVAIAALGAALFIAWKKSETFREIVAGAFRGVVTAGGAVLDWFRDLPGKIGGFFRGLALVITAPYRLAFLAIKTLWNSTVGGFGFEIPSWVPGMGGKSFRIPEMHFGGVVPGAPGQEVLAILQAGERVDRAGAGRDRTILELRSGGSALDDLLVELLSRALRVRGGDVVVLRRIGLGGA